MLYGIYADTDRENVYPSRFADYTDRLAPADVKAARRAIAGKRPGGRSSPPQGQFVVTPRSPNLVLFDLMGTRYIVAGPKARFGSGADGDRFPLLDQLDGIRIYENPAALPRVFLVPRAEVLPTEAVLDRLTAADFDPRASVVLEERPAIPRDGHPTAAGSARIVAYEPHRVAVEASSPAPALLVLTDQHYPGWEATIDGAPAPIHRADYLFRAVALPAGDHRVEFRFVPRSFHRGLALAVAGVVGLILVAIAASRRRRRVR
jgi:hypothetical protein